jgi:hypothetical protein
MKKTITIATMVGLAATLSFAQMNGGGMMRDQDQMHQGMAGQEMTHHMSGMNGQMSGMMQEMSGMIGDTSGVMDHGRMMDMSNLMGEMSTTMQEMSSQMGHGRLNPAQRKKIQERLDAMQKRLAKMNPAEIPAKK